MLVLLVLLIFSLSLSLSLSHTHTHTHTQREREREACWAIKIGKRALVGPRFTSQTCSIYGWRRTEESSSPSTAAK